MQITLYYDFVYLNQYINFERSNRYKGAKIKKEATTALYYMLLNKPKIPTPCKLHFHHYITSKRLDLDNVSAMVCKTTLDAMVKANIIPNDNVNHIIELRHTFEIAKEKGVTITSY